MIKNRLRQESRELRVRVAISRRPFLHVIAQREYDFEEILRARERDIEQPTLFVDLLSVAGGHVGWNVPVGGVDHVHDIPLATLRGMNRREDEIILLAQREPGQVLRRV